MPYKNGFDETPRFESDTRKLYNVLFSFLLVITLNFICPKPSDRSLEAMWYPDFDQISHRSIKWHKWDNFRLKTLILSLLELPGWRLCSFLYAQNLGDPLNCWKTQKTASKLVSHFQEGYTYTQTLVCIVKTSCFLFEMHFNVWDIWQDAYDLSPWRVIEPFQ